MWQPYAQESRRPTLLELKDLTNQVSVDEPVASATSCISNATHESSTVMGTAPAMRA
jgi:hypothetical protein